MSDRVHFPNVNVGRARHGAAARFIGNKSAWVDPDRKHMLKYPRLLHRSGAVHIKACDEQVTDHSGGHGGHGAGVVEVGY
jgi:hypothetical protein